MPAKDDRVKDEIILQAQKLFKQYGLKKTTMDEIAAECGKAKSTLYHYFKNKDEVFESVLDKEFKNLRSMVKEQVDSVNTVKEKIIQYVMHFHTGIINKMNLYRILKYEILDKKVSNVYFNRLIANEIVYMTGILRKAYDKGDLTNINKEQIDWFAEVIIAAFFGIVRYSAENEDGLDQKKLEFTVNNMVPRLF